MTKQFRILFVALILTGLTASAQTLVPAASVWKYYAANSAPAGSWTQLSYDDLAWPQGPAELGYGDGGEATPIPCGVSPCSGTTAGKWITSYYRRKFTVADPSTYGELQMTVVYDDGAVIYINGQEVYRINMPDGPVSWGTLALPALGEPYPADVRNIPASLLVPGENVVAVEMHQTSDTSSDVSFSLQMVGLLAPVVSITSPANNANFTVPFSFSLAADASDPDGSVASVEFYNGPALLGVDTNAPFAITVNSLPEGTHELTARAIDNTGVSKVSAPINVHITDPNPPALIGVSAVTNRVSVVFSKAVVNPSATALANYSISPPLNLISAAYGFSSNIVALAATYVQPNVSYTLTVNNVRDRLGNVIAPNSQATFEVVGFEGQDIGNPATAGSLTGAEGGYNYSGGGTNLGGTSDQFAFGYTERSGDFDFQLRVAGMSMPDLWSKAGLMARETLTANSRFAAAVATPTLAGALFQSRATTGAAAVSTGNFPVNYPNTYLRLRRVGDVFTGYASWDGQAWTQLGSVTLSGAPALMYLGMALASGSPQAVSAQFRDLQDASGGTFGGFRAPIEPPGPSTRRTGFVITEIMYKHPARADAKVLDFIEIYNSNPYWDDIGGYKLTGEADYTFPPGTIIQGGAYVVVAANPAHITEVYGIGNVYGPYTNTLAVSGTVRLRNPQNAILLEIPYSNDPPWPVAADGTGHSLVLARPSYGERNPEAWAPSDRLWGSPGRQDGYTASPLRNVLINEFLANSEAPLVDYIELYNHSRQSVTITDCVLTDDKDENKFVIPAMTIPANGYVSFDQNTLGFGLNSGGESIYLKSPDGRVLDVIKFEAQASNVSSGRHPNGGKDWYALRNRSPAGANGPILINDIVINEIMYDPISGDGDDEFVELYNKGANTVDLGQWRFTAGIAFSFPTNTLLGPSNYLVVARNAARMMSNYANLNSGNVIGNYDGALNNSGERLALGRPDVSYTTNAQGQVSTNIVYVVVDEVTYGVGGHWGKWHNEGGSSLELIDPNSDHRLAYNWAASEESNKSEWTTVTATGMMEHAIGQDNVARAADSIQILTLGEGEYVVDNIEVINASQVNVLAAGNSTLNSGLGGWVARGTHIRSQWTPNGGVGGSGAFHVRASARGDTMGNRALCPLVSQPAGIVTLRAQVRWLKGWPEILLRLMGNHFEAFGRLEVPKNLGTPGARNSRAVANAGPAIANVVHSPVLPAANEAVLVTARISDMDGASATLFYRIDPNTTYVSTPMVDTGTGGDQIANDGIYTGTIPAQPGGTLVAFYVAATDELDAITTLPRDASPTESECLVRFGEPFAPGAFGVYRQWFTQNKVNSFNRPALSNERVFGTFVYGNVRVIYNHSTKFSSSPYHQGQHAGGPVTASVHFAIELPEDDQCLGTENWNKVHAPGNDAFNDNLNQREQIGYWFARQMGLPWNYRRFVQMYVNGNKKGTQGQIMEDTERGGDDFVDSHFPDDNDGNLYKMQPWFEVDDGTGLSLGFQNKEWCTLNKYAPATNAVAHFTPRYRQNWLVRAANGTANDFSPVFALVDAANTPIAGWTAHTLAMEEQADMEQWMRIFSVCHSVGDWDHFGTQNAQNMYGYKPRNGRWNLMIWDMNILMTSATGAWGPGQNLFVVTARDSRMPSLYQNPKFRRMYLRALKEMADVHMQAAKVNPVIDARHNALLASGVTVPAAPLQELKNWIASARAEIARQVGLEDTLIFSVSTPSSITTNNNLITISGLAPVRIHTIRVNGEDYNVTWTTPRNWSFRLAVEEANTQLSIAGYDIYNVPITPTNTITINYTGPAAVPQESLVITEIQYNPLTPETSFVEIYNRSPSVSFDLSGWRMNGLDFTFSHGSTILPGQYLVLAKNGAAFSAAFGAGIPVFGVFDGQLDDGGETISLIKPGAIPEEDVVIDKVKYDDDAPWSAAADGTGPSLQLIDADEDNARASNWAAGGGWRYVTYTGSVQGPPTGNPGTNFFLYMTAAGEVFIDDLKLVTGTVPEAGTNWLLNGDFESPLEGSWLVRGNHAASTQSTEMSHSGNGSLKLSSTGLGNPGTQNLRQFIAPVESNTVFTLSFWYFPSVNGSAFVLRTAPGNNFWTTNFFRPVFGTPGEPNSTARDLPPYANLWINEVQAVNSGGVLDNAGEAEPWIELYNGSATNLALEGYYLSDDFSLPTKWAFPAGSSISPGEFKLIWADNESGESTLAHLHTSVTLNAPTGIVSLARLVDGQPQIVDYVIYKGQQIARSYGDFPNGQPFDDQVFFQPTPGQSNTAADVTVFINEWLAANTATLPLDPVDSDFEDWIELHNPGTAAVDLSGYWLTDNLTNATQYQLPAGTIIPAGGYMLIWADNEPNQTALDPQGRLHASFGLRAQGEDIGLFAPNGFTLIDGINDFPPQTNNVSQGRYPDAGPGPFPFMSTPTPAAPNYVAGENRPPNLLPISDKYIVLGEGLSFTASASDPDPGQTLAFSATGMPSGATLDSGSGLFQWTPIAAQAPSVTTVNVTVRDNGTPQLEANRSFAIYVSLPPRTGINRDDGTINMSIDAIIGRQYQVLYKDNLDDASWTPLGPPITAASNTLDISDTIGTRPQRFYLIQILP